MNSLSRILMLTCSLQLHAAFTQSLTSEQLHQLGEKIWQRESGKSVDKLIFWNQNEPFPSLGIGHFIWYPQGQHHAFAQTFPDVLRFLENNGIALPLWLKQAARSGCPWKSRDIFYAQIGSKHIEQLRDLLRSTVDLQAAFIAERFYQQADAILKQAPPKKRTAIRRHIERLSQDANSLFALIDYCHFKGSGIHTAERYANTGWGLLQVLSCMNPQCSTLQEFNLQAKRLLATRVRNSPPEKNERRWLAGWLARVDSYLPAKTKTIV